ncbi:MAG: DNA-binding response regulator [Syntrophus sp. (in: bacteria)]|nr:DNA-binding response regulator [Syntrophus sp. (in: bacteria)]
MIKVIITDDHPIVREGLEKILSRDENIHVAGTARNARELMSLLHTEECTVVVLDITLPDRNGIDVLEQIKREKPHVNVLMLSVHKEELYAMRAFRAGASGYMTKESAPEELINTIKCIAAGKSYASPFMTEKLFDTIEGKKADASLHGDLTNRELQILCMIAAGETPRAIAEKLYLSVKTVNAYRERILKKMNMRSNAELVRYAFQQGLIE